MEKIQAYRQIKKYLLLKKIIISVLRSSLISYYNLELDSIKMFAFKP